MAGELSLRQFGAAMGVSGEAVRKAIATGRLPQSVIGWTMRGGKRTPYIRDPKAARAAWDMNTLATKAHRRGGGASIEDQDAPPPGGEGKGASVGSTLAKARAMREAFEAKRAQLRYERESGALLPRAEIKAAVWGQARQLRDRLTLIADRLAPILAAETDQHAVAMAIAEEINAALAELADAFAKVAGEDAPAVDPLDDE